MTSIESNQGNEHYRDDLVAQRHLHLVPDLCPQQTSYRKNEATGEVETIVSEQPQRDSFLRAAVHRLLNRYGTDYINRTTDARITS
jgi:hypothetical protein